MIGQPCQCFIHSLSLHQALLSNRDYRPRVHLGLMHTPKLPCIYDRRISMPATYISDFGRSCGKLFIPHSLPITHCRDHRSRRTLACSRSSFGSTLFLVRTVLFNCTSSPVTFGGLVHPVNTSLVQATYAASLRFVQQYQSSLTNSGHKSNSSLLDPSLERT
jgi:hypothetical protein